MTGTENPYVGPTPIPPGKTLYGRDRELRELFHMLKARRVVLLHSPSGAGKTSLVQAALVPALKRERFDVWRTIRLNLSPGALEAPVANRFVASAVASLEEGVPKRHRRPFVELAGLRLADYVAGRPRRQTAPPNVVLVFDQFEEVLTVDPLALETKRELFAQLGEVLREPQVWALFALREDYLAALAPYRDLVPTRLANTFRIDLLGREAAREAIALPAKEGGREFPAAGLLVDDLAKVQVQRVDGSFGTEKGPFVEPVHLQVTCLRLWQSMPDDDLSIDPEDVERFGNVNEALASYYRDSVQLVAGGDVLNERAIRDWFGQRLIVGGIRGQVLREVGKSGGLENALVEGLLDTHLIRGEKRGGATWYELAHDRLLEPVQGDNAAWRVEHLLPWQQQASTWEEQERPAGLLMVDEKLAEANLWAADNEDAVTDVERRFLADSNRLRQSLSRQDKVNQLIQAYRVRGHLLAQLDPLGHQGPSRGTSPELELAHYGLRESDLDSLFSATVLGAGERAVMPLRDILELLRRVYCHEISVQYMHIDGVLAKLWIQSRMENLSAHRRLHRDEQLRILTKLTDAEIFEQFVHRKFLGVKRFSLEGAETLIPLIDLTIEDAGRHGAREVVIGMAHRGRLSVLVNVLGKSPADVFREFADVDADEYLGRGDVKHNLGYSSSVRTAGGQEVRLTLCFNPSHLEFVNPVALGRVRSKQDRFGDIEHRRGLAVLIHGDAAFAGQGVVQELLNMNELPGYRTGGTVHIIVNNQIGFTTPPELARSTAYATDVARMLQTPIFHVNGENPEAVAQVVRWAMDYRAEFGNDVVIDMYCYRRHGHNEGDEPAFTQPRLYEAIRKRRSVRDGYLERLLAIGDVTREEADGIAVRRREQFEEELDRSRASGFTKQDSMSGEEIWKPYVGGKDAEVAEADTTAAQEHLADLLRATTRIPEGFSMHRKLQRPIDARLEMADGRRPLDWAAAEALAIASLLTAGHPVRLSGQDSTRGTFAHRHALFHDTETGETFMPLSHLEPGQAQLQIWDSPLSEVGVLGFEYGYSLDMPEGLVVWEAQFGDFCNVAQVIVDQFISSGETKWNRLSGLVMFLPHGFEGQGPESSSARLERFLSLAAEDNMQIVNLTTPAQLFHCLRRQVMRPLRKPLVVMSPKSLLRHPEAVSTLDELAEGSFQRILPDASRADPKAVTKVLLCCGKVYYELAAERLERRRSDVALLRLEQLYPISRATLHEALSPYADGTPVVWVQEEPENMGALPFVRLHVSSLLDGRWPLATVSRPPSASPATGSPAAHRKEQALLIEEALR